MSSRILTCTSCGKQYRALPGYEEAQTNGAVLCSTCWAEAELRTELEKAEKTLTSTGVIAINSPEALEHKCIELEAEMAELKARLMLKEEAEMTALKEREMAIESRQKLEKTLAEFLTRFAATRQSESAANRELDSVRRESQSAIVDLRGQLDSATQNQKAFEMERNIRTQLESKVCELTAIIAEEREAHGVQLKDREKNSDTVRGLEEKLTALTTSLSATQEEKSAIEAKASQRAELVEELGKNLSIVKAQLAELQASKTTISEDHASALRDKQTLQVEVSELKEWLKIAQDAQMASVNERDQAIAQLKSFRDSAIASLEPMGLECNRDMKELVNESESVLNEARRIREETMQKMEKLERVTADLRTHINNVRRQVTSRVSNVLGTPASQSGLHGAIVPASIPLTAPAESSEAIKQHSSVGAA